MRIFTGQWAAVDREDAVPDRKNRGVEFRYDRQCQRELCDPPYRLTPLRSIPIDRGHNSAFDQSLGYLDLIVVLG